LPARAGPDAEWISAAPHLHPAGYDRGRLMLQFIRDRAQGWVMWTIIGLIIIPFALWGINQYVTTAGNVTIVEINGTELGAAQYNDALQQYRRMLQVATQGQVEFDKLDPVLVKQGVLKTMVEDELLRQRAQAANLRVGDAQVRAAIKTFEGFQRDGRYAADLYDQRLRAVGLSPAGFERQMRRDMLSDQLRQGLAESAFITPGEARALEQLERQRRDFRYLTISAAAYTSAIGATDADIEAYYKAHPDAFQAPERVKIDYVELSVDTLAAQVVVEEQALREYFERNIARYGEPEERNARHVLVHVKRDAAPEAIAVARKRAEELRAELQGGRDFDALAEATPGDAEPRVEFAETGLLRRDVMPKEFDDALFSLASGGISAPVQTDYGFHVILLTEIKAASTRTFDAARTDVERDYRRERAERDLFAEQLDRLGTLAYEQPDTLVPVADELGLKIQSVDFFTRTDGSGIAREPQVVEAAFGSKVALDAENSPVIEIGDDRAIVLRVTAHEPARTKAFDEVKSEAQAALIAERAKERAYAQGADLLKRLHAGEAPDRVAADAGLQWTAASGVDRESPDVTRAVVRQAFKLARPAAGTPTYGGAPSGSGDYAVIALEAVHDPAADSITDAEVHARRARTLAQRRLEEWRAVMAAMEKGAAVKTYPDRL
jgi:peptidyl-prolyl cis-trans isomerase D